MTSPAEPVILIDVTSAVGNTGMTAPQRVAALNRPNMVSVGTIVFLSQELMFFAGLFAMYFVSRANGQGETWDYGASHLNVPYALTITIILVASSFTAQAGVFAAERGDVFCLLHHDRVPRGTRLGWRFGLRRRPASCGKGQVHPGSGNCSHGGVILLALC